MVMLGYQINRCRLSKTYARDLLEDVLVPTGDLIILSDEIKDDYNAENFNTINSERSARDDALDYFSDIASDDFFDFFSDDQFFSTSAFDAGLMWSA